jgi:hypothetical protein
LALRRASSSSDKARERVTLGRRGNSFPPSYPTPDAGAFEVRAAAIEGELERLQREERVPESEPSHPNLLN